MKQVISDYFQLSKKLLGKLLILLIVFSIFTGLLKFLLIDLTQTMWRISELQKEYELILELLEIDPNIVLTTDQKAIQQFYPLLNFMVFGFTFMLYLFPLYSTLIILGRYAFILISEEDFSNEEPKTSLLFPIATKRRFFFSFFLLLFGSLTTFIGVFLLIFPAFIFFLIFSFIILSMLIDEKIGKKAFRGARFYLDENFANNFIITSLFLTSGFLINLIIQPFIMNLFALTLDNYYIWLNPANFRWIFLICFEITFYLIQSICFLPIMPLIIIIFHNQRLSKLADPIQKNALDETNPDIMIVLIPNNEKYYRCAKCDQKLPIASVKCYKCSQLHRINRKHINKKDEAH